MERELWAESSTHQWRWREVDDFYTCSEAEHKWDIGIACILGLFYYCVVFSDNFV